MLQPDIHSFDREGLEQWLEGARAKRMAASVEYHDNLNAKIAHETDKIQRRFMAQVEMLAKEIGALERAEAKVESRLENIHALKQELGILTDSVVDTTGVDPTVEEESEL